MVGSWRREEGQALVEFALVAPLLLLVLFGIVQFGIAFSHSLVLTDAVRAGTRVAVVSRLAPNPDAAVQQAVAVAGVDLDPTKLSVTVASTWQSGADVTVTAKYPYAIGILGIVVSSGDLVSQTTGRVE